MKVVYKKTILEQIKAAANNAALTGRDIEYVELSIKEARQMLRDINYPTDVALHFETWLNEFDTPYCTPIALTAQPSTKVFGVDVKVVA